MTKMARLPTCGRAIRRALKAIYGHSDFESSDNERCKMLHIMFGGSWAITSRCVVKTLRREVAAAAPAPKAALHCKWMETPIGFDSFDCPKSMAGAGQLPLLVSLTISNVKLYHVLIDGGAPSISSALRPSRSCRYRWGSSSRHAHSLEWAQCRLHHVVVSPSRSHSGQQKTFAQRASSSMLRRSAARSTPFWADQLCSSSYQRLITGT
jgi:hypothetical protein